MLKYLIFTYNCVSTLTLLVGCSSTVDCDSDDGEYCSGGTCLAGNIRH